MAGVSPVLESYASARNEFFHWAVKWFTKENLLSEDAPTPDCFQLIKFLETIGYDLKCFERLPKFEANKTDEPKTYEIKITCPQLRLQTVFTSKVVTLEKNIGRKETSSLITEDRKPPFLPVSIGMKQVTREVFSYLMQRLNDVSSDDSNRVPSKKPEVPQQLKEDGNKQSKLEVQKWERHRSLDTILTPDGKSKITDILNRISLCDIRMGQQNDDQMDVDDIVASMGGSNEGLSSRPASPLLGGNAKMLLVREKTWSLGNLNDLNDPRSNPQRTSSPLENSDCQEKNEDFLDRLNEIASKLQELMVDVRKTKRTKSNPTMFHHSPTEPKEKAANLKRASLRRSSLTENAILKEHNLLQRSSSMKRLRSDTEKTPGSPKPTKRSIPRSILTRQTTTTNTPPSDGRTPTFVNASTSGNPITPPRANPVSEYHSRRLASGRSCSIPRLASKSVTNLNAAAATPIQRSISVKKIFKLSGSNNEKSRKEVAKTPGPVHRKRL